MTDSQINPRRWTRRELLARSGMGMATLGLTDLMAVSDARAASSLNPLAAAAPHHRPRAKHIIHIFLNGGPSHMDTFDPKPLLNKYHGKRLPGRNLVTENKTGNAFGSPFKFRKYGRSGIEVSDLFKHTAEMIDEICVIRSMYAYVPFHEPSLLLMNCGDGTLVRPSMGSWMTYGLGTENQNLPGFVAMSPGGLPVKGNENWQSAFLPGIYQGTFVDTQNADDVENLIADIRNPYMGTERQRRQIDLLQSLNRRHQRSGRAADAHLEARIQSYEQAYRMQSEATDAFDISREPEHVREMYGDTPQAKQLLIARRLVERGVRFVQLWHGAGQPWDTHRLNTQMHKKLAGECDRGIGALLRDLKQRGLLEDTLVILGGEFGRTPTVEGPVEDAGRDHNHYGFTVCLAGGGIKGGTVYGSTDEFGWKAEDNPVAVYDLHATILHLMGFDHEKLTYRYAGRDFRLTDVHGHVIKPILA